MKIKRGKISASGAVYAKNLARNTEFKGREPRLNNYRDAFEHESSMAENHRLRKIPPVQFSR